MDLIAQIESIEKPKFGRSYTEIDKKADRISLNRIKSLRRDSTNRNSGPGGPNRSSVQRANTQSSSDKKYTNAD